MRLTKAFKMSNKSFVSCKYWWMRSPVQKHILSEPKTVFSTTPPKAQDVPAGSAFCFMYPVYLRKVCFSTLVPECMYGCFCMCFLGGVVSFFSVLYSQHSVSFQQALCVSWCVRVCYLFHGSASQHDTVLRMLKLNAFFLQFILFYLKKCVKIYQ